MTPSNILNIIILIYYVPALALAVYVGLKHGFQRSAGWFNLNLLAVFRIVGGALGIAAIYRPTNDIYAASLIFFSIGTASLVGALLGLVGRANEATGEASLNARFARLVQLLNIVAIVLGIVGGNYVFSDDVDTRDEGHTLTKAAVILLVVVYVVAVAICFHTFAHRSMLPHSDMRLLLVSAASLPFVLVRLVLAICSTFDYTSSTFSILSTTSAAVIVRAVMGLAMEFVVVALFLWAGVTVDRSVQRDAERALKYASQGSYKGQQGAVYNANLGK